MTRRKIIPTVAAPEGARPIRGFESHYAITPTGEVWSFAKQQGRKHGGRFLKSNVGSHGYPMVTLVDGARRSRQLVHRLVALTFVPNPDPETMTEVNHLNGVKTDVRAANLEWCTTSANHQHAVATGLRRYATAIPLDQVPAIRERIRSGERLHSIAASYGVSHSTISHIKAGRSTAGRGRAYGLQQQEITLTIHEPAQGSLIGGEDDDEREAA